MTEHIGRKVFLELPVCPPLFHRLVPEYKPRYIQSSTTSVKHAIQNFHTIHVAIFLVLCFPTLALSQLSRSISHLRSPGFLDRASFQVNNYQSCTGKSLWPTSLRCACAIDTTLFSDCDRTSVGVYCPAYRFAVWLICQSHVEDIS